MATGKGSEDRKEMPADCAFSSSGESGSEGSYDRSQEDNGKYVLQKRSMDQASAETPGAKGNDISSMNAHLGHPEGNRTNPPATMSQMVVGEKPANLPLPLNIGMEYWSGPGTASAVPPEQGMLKSPGSLAPAITNVAFSGPGSDGGSAELWLQDDRELKRQRRKQANRESARRSRMRKQAEYEELAAKVECLTAENTSLKMEVERLSDVCKKLSSENTSLLERMQKVQGGPQHFVNFGKSKEFHKEDK